MENRFCIVCGDTREVKKHYGVDCCYGCKAFFRRTINDGKKYTCANEGNCSIDKTSRNRCRSCRFQKCLSVGMNESNLRDFKSKNPVDPSPIPSTSDQTNGKISPPWSHTTPVRVSTLSRSGDVSGLLDSFHLRSSESTNLLGFLTAMTRTCLDTYDPNFVNLTRDDWQKLEKNFGRTISLADGLKSPELVCPRTKWDWSCSRVAEPSDFSFMWYRFFVVVADWANSIPQFRMLPKDDQLQLIKLNFVNISMTFLMYFLLKNPVLKDSIPMGNGSYVSKIEKQSILNKLVRASLDAYGTHLFIPMAELDADSTELSLLAAILLFQYHENLSSEGHVLCKDYIDKLFDAFFEYQNLRFLQKSAVEKSRRQSKLLMTVARISQIWAMESDIHLMLSTFDEMNIDGIPKQLLFCDFECKKK